MNQSLVARFLWLTVYVNEVMYSSLCRLFIYVSLLQTTYSCTFKIIRFEERS